MKQKTKRIWRLLLLIALLLWIAQIFYQSLQNGDSSGSRSKWVVEVVQSFLHGVGLQIPVSELLIRKMGHFAEFFLFGILLSLNVRFYTRRWISRIFISGFFSWCVPIADETIQLFTPGRCGAVLDVVLDFSGAAVAILLMNLLFWISVDRFGNA